MMGDVSSHYRLSCSDSETTLQPRTNATMDLLDVIALIQICSMLGVCSVKYIESVEQILAMKIIKRVAEPSRKFGAHTSVGFGLQVVSSNRGRL